MEVSGKVEMPGKVEMSGKVKCETSSEQPAKLRSDSPKSIIRFSHSLAAWGGVHFIHLLRVGYVWVRLGGVGRDAKKNSTKKRQRGKRQGG